MTKGLLSQLTEEQRKELLNFQGEEISGSLIQITNSELIDLMNHNNNNFEVLYDDIPKDGHSSDYIEDDGRQYRLFQFKHLNTNKIYELNYIYQPEFPFVETDIFTDLITIGILVIEDELEETIKEQIIENKPKEQIEDEELWQEYKNIESECRNIEDAKNEIPISVIEDIKNFLNTKQFSMYQLREKIIPYCIQYRVDQKSFWNYVKSFK